MSQQNVEIVRRFGDAWNRRDFDALRELCAPDVEFDRSRSIGPDSGVYVGLAEAEGLWAEWLATWEEHSLDVSELIDSGDDVVVFGYFWARGRTSGAVVEANVSQVFTVRNDLVVRFRLYQNSADALEAAGLTESDISS